MWKALINLREKIGYIPVEKPARELTAHQISFDIVSRDYLKTAKIETGAYVINGERLEVLVFPYGECIPADILNDTSMTALKDLGKKLGDYQAVLLDSEEPDLAAGEYERDGKRYYALDDSQFKALFCCNHCNNLIDHSRSGNRSLQNADKFRLRG